MSEWRVKSQSDSDTVFAEYDDDGKETGNYRYEFPDPARDNMEVAAATTSTPDVTVTVIPATAAEAPRSTKVKDRAIGAAMGGGVVIVVEVVGRALGV